MKPKPCPICGRTPRLWDYGSQAKVECWTTDHDLLSGGDTLDEAGEKWNAGEYDFISCTACRKRENEIRWTYMGRTCCEALENSEPRKTCVKFRRWEL